MNSPTSDRNAFTYEAVPTNTLRQEPDLGTPNPTQIEIAQPVSCVYYVSQAPTAVNMLSIAPHWHVNVPLPQVPTIVIQRFLKGKPFALGIVLIIAATINLIMGIGMIFTVLKLSLISGNLIWATITYIITGILAILAQSKPSICLVRGSLGMNVISAVMSGIGIILASLDLVKLSIEQCRSHSYYCPDYAGGIVVHVLALVNNLLIFSVSIFLGVFGCLALSNVPGVPQVFVIHNEATVPVLQGAVPAFYPSYMQAPPPSYAVDERTEKSALCA